jgi:hypothetical protein
VNARDSVEVHVELDGTTILAGRAQFQRSRGRLQGTTFQYESEYLARPTSYAIDPVLQLTSGTQYTAGLPGSFRQTSLAGAASPIEEADGLISLAASCRLSPQQVRNELSAVVTALEGWREIALANEIPFSQTKRFDRSFSDGLETLRRAAR